MTTCPECAGEMSGSASACPKCGRKKKRTKWWLWAPLAAGGAFLLFGAYLSHQPGAAEKSQARRAIEVCQGDRDRMAGNPGAYALAAGACKMLEDKFAEKYGVSP